MSKEKVISFTFNSSIERTRISFEQLNETNLKMEILNGSDRDLRISPIIHFKDGERLKKESVVFNKKYSLKVCCENKVVESIEFLFETLNLSSNQTKVSFEVE